MARARNIKPGFFTNDELVELAFEVRLLFIGLWTIADREGRLEDRPKKIKMKVFPGDDVDCNAGLDALQDAGFILRYVVDGNRYIQIFNWEKHQNPHIKEAESTIPAPCEHRAETVQEPEIPERAGLIPDSLNLIPDSKENASSKSKLPLIGLKKYLEQCRESDQAAIPDQHAVFRYAEEVGIPEHFLHIAWHAFADRYLNNTKRYRDWPATFCNAVKGNWMKIWYVDAQGQYGLTTVGVQTERAYRAKGAA